MKKIKMPKIFTEFKEFITRGNVMGLAVGMIIGAAFTAIVNALVNSILETPHQRHPHRRRRERACDDAGLQGRCRHYPYG